MENEGGLSKEQRAALDARYKAALHEIQSAIAFDISKGTIRDGATRTMFKHHRVGIDESKSSAGGLVALLIEKELITEDEYVVATTEAAEKEAELQVAYVRKKYGHSATTCSSSRMTPGINFGKLATGIALFDRFPRSCPVKW